MAFHSLFVSLSFPPFWTIFRIYIDKLWNSCSRTFNCRIIIYLCTNHLLLMYKYSSFICHRTRCYIIDMAILMLTFVINIYIYIHVIYRERRTTSTLCFSVYLFIMQLLHQYTNTILRYVSCVQIIIFWYLMHVERVVRRRV